MNALGALPGKVASDFPDGQLGKAHEGPGAMVLDEYRGKMSSMESVEEGVKPLGEGLKPLGEELELRGEAVKLLEDEMKPLGEPTDIGDEGVDPKGMVEIGREDIMEIWIVSGVERDVGRSRINRGEEAKMLRRCAL